MHPLFSRHPAQIQANGASAAQQVTPSNYFLGNSSNLLPSSAQGQPQRSINNPQFAPPFNNSDIHLRNGNATMPNRSISIPSSHLINAPNPNQPFPLLNGTPPSGQFQSGFRPHNLNSMARNQINYSQPKGQLFAHNSMNLAPNLNQIYSFPNGQLGPQSPMQHKNQFIPMQMPNYTQVVPGNLLPFQSQNATLVAMQQFGLVHSHGVVKHGNQEQHRWIPLTMEANASKQSPNTVRQLHGNSSFQFAFGSVPPQQTQNFSPGFTKPWVGTVQPQQTQNFSPVCSKPCVGSVQPHQTQNFSPVFTKSWVGSVQPHRTQNFCPVSQKPEKMAVNEDSALGKLVNSLDNKDGKSVKNIWSCAISKKATQSSKAKKREHSEEEQQRKEVKQSNGGRSDGDGDADKEKYVYINKSGEHTTFPDLSRSLNLARTMASEARRKSNQRRKLRRRMKKQKKESETPNAAVNVVEAEKHVDSTKDADTTMSLQTESVERKDNFVLRKLLRGPRYFDSPESCWQICYNCGNDDHKTADCNMQKRKKPCYICGGFEHYARHCKQRKDWLNSNKIGNFAKGHLEKDLINNEDDKICLRCGNSGHDTFSCSNDYSPDDLKEIQCYICNNLGHLCCADFTDEGPRRVSCYQCGMSGHPGSGCPKLQSSNRDSHSDALCHSCGQKGHLARECKKICIGGSVVSVN